MTELTIRKPDDWHLHLRDGAMLEGVVHWSARDIARAIIMPNLVPPVVTGAQASQYRERILAAAPGFQPLMTLYLTDTTDPEDVVSAYEAGIIKAVKLYPAGATTNSDSGVTKIDRVRGVLERMAEMGIPLCIHGEVTNPEVDIFDRERVFIDTVLEPMRQHHPALHIILEHITTADGAEYVRATQNVAATITTHHLIINRNHMLAGGIRPHYYCLPVAKRERHRQALRHAAISGDPHFFSGTDSAPHVDAAKETGCGCAGCFTAPNHLACLAHVFEEEGALDKLEGFVSLHGAAYYGMEPNSETITLVREDAPVAYPDKIDTGAGPVTVFDPGFPLHWRVKESS
ncbi:MAG: dihydroorotase [Pseudomonadota bacterium]